MTCKECARFSEVLAQNMPGFDRSGTKPICIGISWVNSTRLGSVPREIQKVDGHNHIMSSASACGFAGHPIPE